MIVLAFDTSAPHCAAALWRDGHIVAERREPMARGQSERLMVLLEEMLRECNITWRDLDALGVGVGPGNFTGIRIGVSAARGLAYGLGVPAIGVDRFDVTAASTQTQGIPCVAATQDNVYARPAAKAPKLLSRAQAEQLGEPLVFEPADFNPAVVIAELASKRIADDNPRPAPLYIKAADAAPARDAPPVILR